MSKLVDKERLAKLAKALDDRAKAAVAAEKERALSAEQAIEAKADANAAAIAAINNEENGLLKQAKDYADQKDGELNNIIKDKVAQADYDAKILLIDQKDDAQDADIKDLEAAVEQIKTQIGQGDLTGVDKKIDDAVAALEAADTALDNRIKVFEANGAKDVAALMNRTTALEEKVGHDVEGEEAASGLFAEVDEAKAAAEAAAQAAAAEKTRAEGQEAAIRQEMADEAARVNQKIADDIAAESALRVAEEQRIEGLVNAEAQRADAAEKANKASIDAINNAETGILKQAKDYADGKVKDEKERAEGVEQGLDDRLKVVEASVGDGGALEGRVAANEAKLAGLKKDTVQTAINDAEANAKAHAEQKIADLVDSAPDAMNTLNELAAAINANQGVYDAYVAEHATAMATMKSDLQKEIDDDIAAARTLITAEIDAGVKAEADRAKVEEAAIRGEFAEADDVLSGRITTLEGLVVGGEGEGLAAVIADVAQNKADIENLKDADVELQTAIDGKVAQSAYDTKVGELVNADTALDNRIKVFEAGGAKDVAAKEVRLAAAEGEIDALQAFMNGHSHEAMEADIAANAKAIEDEVKEGGARDKAIEAALEAYSTTEEMKAILGNVVSSLALTMEDDKVVLKLGGKEGIAVTEVSLDMATDADIDAIIAGLDAE